MKNWFSRIIEKFKGMSKKQKIALGCSSAAVLVAVVAIIVICIVNMSYVTVTFNTAGGEKIESVRLDKGDTLSNLPMASKDGYVFTGWCLDEKCQKSFYTSKPIESDITLYARYQEKKSLYNEEAPTEYFLDECDHKFSFKIYSQAEITQDNLYDYIIIDTFGEDIPELKVSKDTIENTYIIEPKTEYVAGRMYEVAVTNSARFADIGVADEDLSALVTLQFTIYKDEVYDVVYKDGIIELSSNDVKKIQDGYYMVLNSATSNVKVGSTVRVTDTQSGLTTFFNVDAIDNKGEYSVLAVSDCAIEELVDEFEVYSKDVAMDIDALLEQIDKDAIVKALETSEGTEQLTNALALAISSSPTVNQMLDNATNTGFSDNAQITGGLKLDIDASTLREGMFIEVELGKAVNKNFSSDVENDWIAVHITIGYETKLKNTVAVQISFGITQYIRMDADGAGSLSDMYAEGHLDIYTQTDVELKAYVYSSQEQVPSSDPQDSSFAEDIIDISEEILSAFKGEGDDNIVAEMQELLKSSGNSINLLRQPLIMVPIPIGGVFQINFGLDLVINLDLAAGINIDMSVCNHNRFGIEVDLDWDKCNVETYHTKIPAYNKTSFDLYAAGYIGVEVGLAGYAEFTFVGVFSEFGAVGLELQVGIYVDIYGYMHISFETGVTDNANDYDGALYMEIGVYVSLDIYLESNVLSFRENWEVFHFKNKLCSWGQKETVIGFDIEQKGDTIPVMRGSSMNIGDLYTITKKYMDITTGEVRTEPYSGDVEITFSERNFRYSDYSKKIYYDNASSGNFYVTAYVYATDYIWTWLGGSKKDVATAEFKFLWVEPNYAGAIDNGKDIVTVTYELEVDGETVATKTREVVAGSLAGAIDWDIVSDKNGNNTAYVKTYGTSYGSWDKNPNNTVVNEDTTFTYTTYKQYKYVSIIYYDGTDWIGQVYAVNVGDTPNVDIPNVDGLTFDSWISSEDEQYVSVYGKPDGKLKTVLEFETVTAAWSKYAPYIEDMSKPLIDEKFASSDEALKFLQNNAATYKDRADQIYLAKYNTLYYDVVFETKRGNYNYEYTFGQKPSIDTGYITSVLGYEFVGWDADGDGQVDYQTSELPVVVADNRYVAVYTEHSFDVTVYDADKKVTEYKGMKYGDALPEEINKLADVLVKDEAGNVVGVNKFVGWCWRHRDVYTGILENPILIDDIDAMVVIGSDVYYPYYVYEADTEAVATDPNKLNIILGTQVDMYDTKTGDKGTQTFEGYYYDAAKGALYITANDIRLSGYAKDIIIIIGEDVERITLSDLTVVSGQNRDYSLTSINGLGSVENLKIYSWADNYNYALIRVLSKELDMTISGEVKLTKTRTDGKDSVVILNIADYTEDAAGEAVLVPSNINIQGDRADAKLILNGNEAIRHGGDISISNMELNATTEYTTINAEKNVTMNLLTLTVRRGEQKGMEQAVAAGGKITVMDCKLDVEGRLQADCCGEDEIAISIAGNTTGRIVASEMSPLYLGSNFENVAKKIYIGIYSGCTLTLEMSGGTESVICTGECNTLEWDGVITDIQCKMLLKDGWYKLVTEDGKPIDKLVITGKR